MHEVDIELYISALVLDPNLVLAGEALGSSKENEAGKQGELHAFN